MKIIPIEENMTKVRLRWFGYLRRRLLEALVKNVNQIIFILMKKGKYRFKKKMILRDAIKMNFWLKDIPKNLI